MVRSVTRLRGSGNEVLISAERPAVLIGMPAATSLDGASVASSPPAYVAAVCQEAAGRARVGADIVEVRVAGANVDELACLPAVVEAVSRIIPAPLCIGARDPGALYAALAGCRGKPLVYLVEQQAATWKDFLAVAQRRGAAVIVQAVESDGVPPTYDERVDCARRILRESISAGIPRDDVIIDPVGLPVAGNETAAAEVLMLAAHLSQIDTINLALRVDAVSAGLPDSESFGSMLIGRALAAGITCPIVATAAGLRSVLMANLLLGRAGALRHYLEFAESRP